jgi:hypothetical protein
MVLWSIIGTWLYDCIDKYYRQNPGQMAAHMLFEVATHRKGAAVPSFYSLPAKMANQYLSEDATKTFALNRNSQLCPKVVITT